MKNIKTKNRISKKYIFTFITILFFFSISNAQETKIEFSNTTFYLRKELEENDSGPKIKKIVILNDKKNFIHSSHILFKKEEDHSSEQIEIGGYEVKNGKLILYTCWIKAGDALDAPCGVQKIVYNNFTKGGRLLAIEKNLLYIIAGPQSEESRSSEGGQEFLEKMPIDSIEKNNLETYIYLIEKKYHGHFLRDKEAEKLIREVKTFLKKEIEAATSHWNKIELYQLEGICK